MALSEKRRLFVEAYMGEAKGNATEAARMAGYAHPGSQGHRLLKNAEIHAAIQERVDADSRVANRDDLQRFWTSVMEDTNQSMKDRLKASELLGKAQAAFVARVEHSGKVDVDAQLRKMSEDELREALAEEGWTPPSED